MHAQDRAHGNAGAQYLGHLRDQGGQRAFAQALLHLLRQLIHARLQLGRCAGVVAQVGRRKQWPGTAAQQSLQTHAVLCTCSNAGSWLSY